jgi:hypothetical protein
MRSWTNYFDTHDNCDHEDMYRFDLNTTPQRLHSPHFAIDRQRARNPVDVQVLSSALAARSRAK